MTKDEFEKYILNHEYATHGIKEATRKLFKSNVCIPKGKNRHPYADVLHEWVEKRKVEYTFKLGGANIGWFSLDYDVLNEKYEYRIKPSDPTYEYQWINTFKGAAVISKSFLTEDEAYENWEYRIEATKRERKQ